jgi:hypothetical protein
MTRSELTAAKVNLRDSIHTLASEPVSDLDGIEAEVEELFSRLEAEVGEEEGTPAG